MSTGVVLLTVSELKARRNDGAPATIGSRTSSAYILARMAPMAIAVGIGWMVIGIVYYARLSMVVRRARFKATKD
jgi:hypothetical protein